MLHYANELVTQSLLMTALTMPRGQTACATDDHLQRIDAVGAKDGRKAIRPMQTHLVACEARLVFEQRGEPPGGRATALQLRPRPMSASR